MFPELLYICFVLYLPSEFIACSGWFDSGFGFGLVEAVQRNWNRYLQKRNHSSARTAYLSYILFAILASNQN